MAQPLSAAAAASSWGTVRELVEKHFVQYLFDAPEMLQRVLDAVPARLYEIWPRLTMVRALAAATRRPIMMVDASAHQQFRTWVERQSRPAPRDILMLLAARIHEATMVGWYRDANTSVDEALGLLRSQQDDTDGLGDIAALVLLECGLVKLLMTDAESSVVCFSEAVRWSAVAGNPSLARFAREHLALGFTLCARNQTAAELLPDAEPDSPETISVRWHFGPAGLLARAAIAVSALQLDHAEELLRRFEEHSARSVLMPVAMHVRALIALWRDNRWEAIHELDGYLLRDAARVPPSSAFGAMLRGDLVYLYQSVGEIKSAATTLRAPGLMEEHPGLLGPRVIQSILTGQADHARALLDDAVVGAGTPVRSTPYGAVIHAVIEHVTTGSVSQRSLQAAAMAMNYHHEYVPLFHAPAALRRELAPLVNTTVPDVPDVFPYRLHVRLTARERELLHALAGGRSVDRIAASLHISISTARTHIRTLYRKLGAHTRAEALEYARQVIPPEWG